MLTRLTNESLKQYQGFVIDKSLIKKIFSWKEPSKAKSKAIFKKDNDEFAYDLKQEQIKNEIQQRHVFSYNYRQRYWASWKDTLHWLFCE